MEENTTYSSEESQEFLKALEQSNENTRVESGDIKSGKVLQIAENFIYIDIGLKAEAKIDKSEFDALPNIGDDIDVFITNKEDEDGQLIVSKKLADKMRASKEIDEAFEANKNIKGFVKDAIKGGFSISICGTLAFCPYSLIDIRPSNDEKEYIGKEYDFRIIKKTNRDVVLSRRVILEEIRNFTVNNFLESLKEGDVIQGKIKNIEKFGTFVEIAPGLDGFLAIPNTSWDKVIDVNKVIKKNEERMFKVISVDKEKQKVDLGIKQLDDDPWVKFVEMYTTDDVLKGEVTSIKQFGAFIKVYEGIEGLAHISDISWNTHAQNTRDYVKIGDFVECKILEININERRLSLGLKQIQDNPWDSILKEYPIQSIVKCKVKRILRNFAVFELPNGLEGICDISDFDWSNNLVNIDNYVKENDEIEVVVISVEKDKQKVKLSYKHMKDSPWKLFEKKNPVGSTITASVISIIPGVGVVVSLDDGLEGFVHVSQLDMPKSSNINNIIEVGKSYPFLIREISQSKRRISLSQKDYIEGEAKKEIKNYITNDEPDSLTFNYFTDLNKN